jgi:hypothetical protein
MVAADLGRSPDRASAHGRRYAYGSFVGYARLGCRGIYGPAGPGIVGQRDKGLAADLLHGNAPRRGQTMLARHHGVKDLPPERHHSDRIGQLVHKSNS